MIQEGVRTKLTYEIERLIAAARIKESLNAKMSCLSPRPVRRHYYLNEYLEAKLHFYTSNELL